MAADNNSNTLPGAVLASKSSKHCQPTSSGPGGLSLNGEKSGPSAKNWPSTDGRKCAHCGNIKHAHETCFKLHDMLNGGMNSKPKNGIM